MMEENNRKGPGIFYAVVGVATLVVAIIGATFAYFSASANNDETITGSTASAGGVDLVITPITSTGTNMIPLNLMDNGDPTSAAKGDADQFAKAITNKCVDANGNNVCQIYSIKVTNKSTTSKIQVRGTLNLEATATNMKWQLLTDDTTTTRADFATVVDKGTSGNITVGGNSGGAGKDVFSKYLEAQGVITYYVLVWLEETGAEQEDADAAKTFTGHVAFSAVDASGTATGLTASFSA